MIFRAYLELLCFDFRLARKDFAALRNNVGGIPVAATARSFCSAEKIVRSLDLAAALYFKPVYCLQRSAAATCLLRRAAHAAQMIIGVQQLPFLAHAWVEIDGNVVGDKPYMREIYAELCRF